MSFVRFISVEGEAPAFHKLVGFTPEAATVELYDALDGEAVSTVAYPLPAQVILTDPTAHIEYVVEPGNYTADLVFAYLRGEGGPLAGGSVIIPV